MVKICPREKVWVYPASQKTSSNLVWLLLHLVRRMDGNQNPKNSWNVSWDNPAGCGGQCGSIAHSWVSRGAQCLRNLVSLAAFFSPFCVACCVLYLYKNLNPLAFFSLCTSCCDGYLTSPVDSRTCSRDTGSNLYKPVALRSVS